MSAPHQGRGIYRDDGVTPETIIIWLVDGRGRNLARCEVLARLATPDTAALMSTWLNMLDPIPALRVVRGSVPAEGPRRARTRRRSRSALSVIRGGSGGE